MSLCQGCISGVAHTGTPQGEKVEFGKYDAYVATPTVDYPKDKVLLYLPDVFMFGIPNNMLNADYFAKNGFKTVIPEFLNGDPVGPDQLNDPNFNLGAWLANHGPEQTMPALEAVMNGLREQGVKEFGALGFCFGARYVFNLSFSKDIKVGAVAHPSLLQVPDDVEKLKDSKTPMLIVSNSPDFQWDNDKSEVADKVLGPLGPELYKRTYYGGLNHGFVVRGDEKDPKQKEAKESALKDMVEWMQAKL